MSETPKPDGHDSWLDALIDCESVYWDTTDGSVAYPHECRLFAKAELADLRAEHARLRRGIRDLAFEMERREMAVLAGSLLLWLDGQIQALTFKEEP